mgnify:CR=1 FL=1
MASRSNRRAAMTTARFTGVGLTDAADHRRGVGAMPHAA